MERAEMRHVISRFSIAFIFLVFGVWEIVHPTYWTAFLPPFVTAVADSAKTVMVHGMILSVLGLAILFGYFTRIAAALGTLVMLGIVASLWTVSGFTDLLVRDIVITLFTLTLVVDDTKYFELSDMLWLVFGFGGEKYIGRKRRQRQ